MSGQYVPPGLAQLAERHTRLPTAAWRRFVAWLLRGYELHADEESLARLRRLDRQHTGLEHGRPGPGP